MTYSQFAILNGNIMIAASFITEKTGPIALAVLWIVLSYYIIWKDSKE